MMSDLSWLIGLVGTVVGALLTWATTYLTEERRRKQEERERLRQASARWLGSHQVTSMRVAALAPLITDLGEGSDAAVAALDIALRDLLPELKELTTALAEISLMEPSRDVRARARSMSATIGSLYGTAQTIRHSHAAALRTKQRHSALKQKLLVVPPETPGRSEIESDLEQFEMELDASHARLSEVRAMSDKLESLAAGMVALTESFADYLADRYRAS